MSRSATTSFIDDAIRYPRETMAAVREFARSKPWRGTREEREEKFRAVHAKLCEAYGVEAKLQFRNAADESTSISSYYNHRRKTIVLAGRLSVVTYLNMFSRVIECEGRDVIKWSVNLFKRRFPISFGRCRMVGHLLVRNSEASNYTPTEWGVAYNRRESNNAAEGEIQDVEGGQL